MPLSIRPIAFNNGLQVVGRDSSGNAALWSGGSVTGIGPIVTPTLIGDTGAILGYDNGANVLVKRGDDVNTIASLASTYRVFAGGLLPASTAMVITDSTGATTHPNFEFRFGGEAMWARTFRGQWDAIAGALDGGTMIRFRVSEDEPQLVSHYARPGGPNVDIAPTLFPLAVAPEGRLLALQTGDGTARILQVADNGIVTQVNPGLPSGVTGFDDGLSGQLNAKGRILIETANGDMESSQVGEGIFAQLYTWTKAGGWVDLTNSASSAGLSPRAVAVNGWGDMLVAYDDTTSNAWVESKPAGAILRQPRAALTGVIMNSATSGRARSGRVPGSVSRKVVRLGGGPVDLVAHTSTLGTFRFEVPEGIGYSIQAPAGTCVHVTNGCHTVVPFDVKPGAAPVNLDRTTVASLASFTARRETVVRRARGTASFSIQCRAPTACKVRLTVKSGRTVIGTSGKVLVIPRNRSRSVKVTLNKASTRLFVRSARLPVTTTLVVTAGSERTTIVQGFHLQR